MWRRALPLLVWLGCLGVAVALLQALGDGRLAAPALTDPGAWPAWAAGRDPLEVVMVVLRLLALAGAWYLTGVTSVSVIARLLRAVRLVRLADALSVGPVRAIVQQALGVSLAAGVLAASVPGAPTPGRAAAPDARADVAVMALVDEADDIQDQVAVEQPDDVLAPDAADAPEVMVPVPAPSVGPPATTQAATTDAPPDAPGSATAAPTAPADPADPTAPGPGAREVRVEPGDHFWGLAERAVAAHLGRPGTETEVLAHWESMLAANADRLVVADNPDLLLPGQTVVVPDVAEPLA